MFIIKTIFVVVVTDTLKEERELSNKDPNAKNLSPMLTENARGK